MMLKKEKIVNIVISRKIDRINKKEAIKGR